MENNDIENKNNNKNTEFVTIFNFECKNCKTKIGQLNSNGIDKDKIVCPKCGSSNITYGTLI